jgi:hypothetical protein
MAGFGINGVEPLGPTLRDCFLISLTFVSASWSSDVACSGSGCKQSHFTGGG